MTNGSYIKKQEFTCYKQRIRYELVNAIIAYKKVQIVAKHLLITTLIKNISIKYQLVRFKFDSIRVSLGEWGSSAGHLYLAIQLALAKGRRISSNRA